MGSICMIEIRDAFTSEFKMLGLIFADWNMSGSMNQDIRSLQDRVREQSQFELRFIAAI